MGLLYLNIFDWIDKHPRLNKNYTEVPNLEKYGLTRESPAQQTLDRPHSMKNCYIYLSSLPLTSLPYTDWQTYLHLLAHRKRADLMGDLATLYPAILHLGGEDAGREMQRVCRQWK